MAKYDGWVVKSFWTDPSFLLIWTFEETRREVINKWGKDIWKKGRRKGEYKAVKVKLVEVK